MSKTSKRHNQLSGGPTGRPAERAQALAEFALVLPILVLLLLGAFWMGMATYKSQMASSAMVKPATQKMVMADDPNTISGGQLAGYVNSGAAGGTIPLGGSVAVSLAGNTPTTTILEGNMPVPIPIPGVSQANIKVSYAINRNLLLPASNGATSRPLATPYVPGCGATSCP